MSNDTEKFCDKDTVKIERGLHAIYFCATGRVVLEKSYFENWATAVLEWEIADEVEENKFVSLNNELFSRKLLKAYIMNGPFNQATRITTKRKTMSFFLKRSTKEETKT